MWEWLGQGWRHLRALLAFFYPVTLIFQGIWLMLSNLRLLQSSWPPMLVTGLLFINGIYVGLAHLNAGINSWLQPYLRDPLIADYVRLIKGLAGPDLAQALFLGIFLPLSSLVCLPLLEKISRDTEVLLAGYEKKALSQRLSFGAVMLEMGLLACLMLLLGLVSLALVWIPYVGPWLARLLSCLFIGFECLDITLARQHVSLRDKGLLLKDTLPAFVLFVLPLLATFYLPYLQILVLPAVTIGGVLYLRKFS